MREDREGTKCVRTVATGSPFPGWCPLPYGKGQKAENYISQTLLQPEFLTQDRVYQSDALRSILYVIQNEVDAFWCFCGFMELVVRLGAGGGRWAPSRARSVLTGRPTHSTGTSRRVRRR